MSDYPLWRYATWRERIGISVAFLMAALVATAMFATGLYVFAMMVDGIGVRQEQHDRCLKQATNGYEIRECH